MKRLLILSIASIALVLGSCRQATDDKRSPDATATEETDLILTALDWQEPEIEPVVLIETDQTTLPPTQAEAVTTARTHLDRLLADGWALKSEHWHRGGATLTLARNIVDVLKVNVVAEVRGTEDGPKGFVVIRNELGHRIPDRDAPGFEPPDVPRYPGSTRIRWMNILGEWSGKYLALDDLEKVKTFYMDSLPSFGWIYKGVQAGKLHFEKGGIASADPITQDDIDISDPIGNVAKMIPSTLNIILADDEGVSNIGFGRSAGAGDTSDISIRAEPYRLRAEREVDPSRVVTRVDPESALPWYPGTADKVQTPEWFSLKGPETHTLKFVVPRDQVQAERENIREFYLREMPKKGWTLELEKMWGDGTELNYRRGGVTGRVSIQNTGAKFIDNPNVPPSAISMLPVRIELRFPVPERDIAGEDVADVPRFPGSKRFYFLKVAMDHVVKFKAAGTADQVYEWFTAELPRNGWKLSGADQDGLMFTPKGGPASGIEAFGSGQWVPTILGIRAKDEGYGVVDFGMDLSKGDL